MPFEIKCDIAKTIAGLTELEKQHVPFALAKTLTSCAQGGQLALQKAIPRTFKKSPDLPPPVSDFTVKGVRIHRAEKTGNPITAEVYTDTTNWKSGAPGYMQQQEEGGEKVPHNGRQYLAIPTTYLRALFTGPIPQELRPKNLLGAVNGKYVVYRSYGKEKPSAQFRRRNQKIVKGMVFFLAPSVAEPKWIMGRHVGERDAHPYYFFIRQGDVKPRLRARAIIEDVATKILPTVWHNTWKEMYLKGLHWKG